MFEILAQSLLIATRMQAGARTTSVDDHALWYEQILRERQLRAERLRAARILQKG